MSRISRTNMFALLVVSLAASPSAQSATSVADILVTAFHDKQWEVRYDLAEPAKELVFDRSPDKSRLHSWLPDHLFEIVSTRQGEAVRRKDRTEFRTLRIRVSAEYRPLPNDYAAFSPFGDGSMLFHTGRFLACPDTCPDDATWSFSLWADPSDSIVLNGRRESYFTQWTESDSGRMVYVGKNTGMQTSEFTAIIDEMMPESVRGPLLSDLPALIGRFADRLGPLNEPVTLFASYDRGHKQGWGRQGGTLPNQIFTHFYGSEWERQMLQPGFAFELAWHFAHETAHLYQRQRFSTEPGNSWIHEGSAEAFAALELRSRNEAASIAVGEKIEQTRKKCAEDIGARPMNEVFLGSALAAAYSCGLLLNLYIDTQVRNRNPDGLYAVWREYLRRTAGSSPRNRSVYLDSISSVGGPELAAHVKALLDAKHPNIEIDQEPNESASGREATMF